MLRRKAIVTALAAAVFGGASMAAHAQFANVFVPELAMIDASLCRAPGAGGAPALIRLAQATTDAPKKKSEVSPAAPAAAKAVPATAQPDDPPLMSGLGTRTTKITTSSQLARQYFDQGYRLAWGFNHDEAIRAFRKAQRLDPACAMCYWGEAWALGPNINAPMDEKANAPALAAIANAQKHVAKASPRERALIAALARRYAANAGAERSALDT